MFSASAAFAFLSNYLIFGRTELQGGLLTPFSSFPISYRACCYMGVRNQGVPTAHLWLEQLHTLSRCSLNGSLEAKAFADRDGYRVFQYPISEADPLGRAKRDVAIKPRRRRR